MRLTVQPAPTVAAFGRGSHGHKYTNGLSSNKNGHEGGVGAAAGVPAAHGKGPSDLRPTPARLSASQRVRVHACVCIYLFQMKQILGSKKSTAVASCTKPPHAVSFYIPHGNTLHWLLPLEQTRK